MKTKTMTFTVVAAALAGAAVGSLVSLLISAGTGPDRVGFVIQEGWDDMPPAPSEYLDVAMEAPISRLFVGRDRLTRDDIVIAGQAIDQASLLLHEHPDFPERDTIRNALYAWDVLRAWEIQKRFDEEAEAKSRAAR